LKLERKLAWTIHDATDRVGTREHRLIATFAGRSRAEIKEIADNFKTAYGKDLDTIIKSETSGWFKRTLVYMVHQSDEGLLYVDRNAIKRIRDI